MASNHKLATIARNGAADGIASKYDNGSYRKIYTGSPPANLTDSPTGTLLVTIPLPNPTYGAASAGVCTANTITPVAATGSGDAGWWRDFTSADAPIRQGTAGNSGDSPDLTFDNKSIVASGTVAIPSDTFTVPIQ